MDQKISDIKEHYKTKIDELYSVLMSKDNIIAELESKIDDLSATLKDVNANQKDSDNYTLITINNALRSNLKRTEQEVKTVTKKYEDLKKIMDLQSLVQKGGFEKELVRLSLEPSNSLSVPKVSKSSTKPNQILELMSMGGVKLIDLVNAAESSPKKN